VESHAARYEPIQRSLRDRSFDLSEQPSSVRAADAILRFVGPRTMRTPVLQSSAA
jgi:hypothetical protein